MIYIQCKNDDGLETVDEADTYAEARSMLNEYRMSDKTSTYYLSNRACKAWREMPVIKGQKVVDQQK